MSASLMRVLAEAADGYRTGSPVWIVASYERPHTIQLVTADSVEAFSVAQKAGAPFGSFGPFVTAPDPLPTDRPRVTEIRIITAGPGEVADTMLVDPVHSDAVLWSLAAVEKFCAPFYALVYGVPQAQLMLNELMEALGRGGVAEHKSWSICRAVQQTAR